MPRAHVPAGSAAAEQDDSLEVHPATQHAEQSQVGEREPSPLTSLDSDDGEGEEEPSSESEEEPAADSQGFWEAEAILDENKTSFLIAWKGTDQRGKPWSPTWEPKSNANDGLVQYWRQQKRDARKAGKAAKKERKNEAKAARKPVSSVLAAAGAEASRTQSNKNSSPLRRRQRSVEIAIEVPLPRPSAKRKMVVPSSPEGSASPAPRPSKPAEVPAPRPHGDCSPARKKKRVTFNLALSSDVEEQEQPIARSEPIRTVKARKEVVPLQVKLAARGDEREAEELVQSSGSTSASSGATVIPDSQVMPAEPVALKPTDVDGHMRYDLPGPAHSPATSQSDLDSVHAHDDDIPVFDPLRRDDEDRDSSAEPEQQRRMRPVPVPAAAMFGIFNRPALQSSQLDPIEDPDSSPQRPGYRRQLSQQRNSPRAAPVKGRLELVVQDDDSPASSFEAEVQSSAAASYVTLPLSQPDEADLARSILFARSISSRNTARASASPSQVKRPHALSAPIQHEDILGDGTVARAATRPSLSPSPRFDDRSELIEEEAQFEGLGGYAEQFFNEIFDFTGGVGASQARAGAKADSEARDAGEQQPASNGGGYSGAYSSASQGAPASQGHVNSNAAPSYTAEGAGSSAFAASGSAGAFSQQQHSGGGYSQLPDWHGTSSAAGPSIKRPFEDDSLNDGKKPRVESQAARPQPAPASSPFDAILNKPSQSPIMAHATAPVYTQSAHSSVSYGSAPSQAQTRVPSVGLSQAAPIALTSPSLARVQSAEPFVIPKPGKLATGEVSPSFARHLSGFRSPSPLPPAAAPVPPQGPPSVGQTTSRIGSPAPLGAQVENLVSLVRASPSISATDGTKEEIERFLRNPQGYASMTSAPLLATEFWAFELRRHVVDGVEKVDFIIIRSREGTFQLKRASADKLPIEFARSLSQVTSRARGLTPLVDAAPTLATFSPAPAAASVTLQPVVSQMTREQLELEVEQLRKQSKASEAELSSLRPLTAEAAQLRNEVQTLTKQNKSLVSSRESAQSDLSYMQAQYQAASQAAVERASECRIAETETARLKGLLETGIQQKEAVYKSEIKAVRSMYARMQKEMALYKAESRRMQEAQVREKAAKWDDHLATLKLESKRAALQRAGEPSEDLDDDEAGNLPAATYSQPEPSTIVSTYDLTASAPSQLPSHVPAASLGLANLEPDMLQPNQPLLAANSAAVSQATLNLDDLLVDNPVAAPGPEQYRCEWRVGPSDTQAETCGEAKETKTQLREHVLRDHVQD